MIDENEYEEIPYGTSKPIDFRGLLLKIAHGWKTIVIWMLVAGAIGVFIGFCSPKVYTVTSKLSPELSYRSTSGNLSSLASLAGVNLNSLSGNTDAFRPDLYPEIIESVPFIVDLFELPVSVVEKKDTISTNYYDYMLNYQKKAWWTTVMGWPFDLLNWVKSLFSPDEEADEDPTHPVVDKYHLTKHQYNVYKAVKKNISTTVDRKNYMLTIAVEDQSKIVAADISQLIIDNLTRYITEYRTEKARKDLAYYQEIYDEAKDDYTAKQREYARYYDANQGTVSRLSQVRQQQLQNEVNLKFQVFSTASQQLQLAKAKVQQETPVLACLQPPTVPLKGKPSKLSLLVTYMFFGLFLSFIWLLWLKDWIKGLKKQD